MDRVDTHAMEIPEGNRDGEFSDKPDFYQEAYKTGSYGEIGDGHGVTSDWRRL